MGDTAPRSAGHPPVVAVLDVGGTTVNAAAVDIDGKMIGSVCTEPSPQGESADGIVAVLARLITRCIAEARAVDREVACAAVCMPGPFDYAEGVSHMTHKFPALLGIDLRAALRAVVALEPVFVNDADAAGHGVWLCEAATVERLAVVTLGTGIGTALLVGGRSFRTSPNPEGAEIWSAAYQDGIFEDYVSARAIAEAYVRSGGDEISVRRIADQARDGDQRALEVLGEFAEHLGSGLVELLEGFRPDAIAFTGNISKAWDLFGETTVLHFDRTSSRSVELWASALPYPALIGGAHLCANAPPAADMRTVS
ncbi:MAG: ROK family protein [Acidimicrobiia bacterium]|nr:ROK family protein [Acidimicrobiia bacterium]